MKLKRSSNHPCYYHILLFITSHLWSGTESEARPGFSINAPRRVTVQRGLCVYIPCNFTVSKAETLTRNVLGAWYHAEGQRFVASNTNRMNLNNGRSFLIGNVQRGDCNLYIEDPLPEDEGRYIFRIEDNVKFTYVDIQPYIEVTELKSKPEISPTKSWLDGEEVTLNCTSPVRCVRITPRITWVGNIQNGRVENQVINHANGTKTHISAMTFTARKDLHNSTLSCIVWLKGELTTRQQITINVEYKPRIVNGRKSSCQKFENRLECMCLIQSFPIPTVEWKMNGEFINSSSHMEVNVFTEISDSVANSTLTFPANTQESRNISCVASNIHGELVLELFNETARSIPKAFPTAAIYGGCFAAVCIVTGVFLIMFYRKRKKMHNQEKLRQTHVSVADPIYGNSEAFSNNIHEVGQTPQNNPQPPPEDGSVYQDIQDLQYMSVNFSKLKPKVATEEEEVEYSAIKHIH
ncbi:sialic acid-binding Ig-like lectin 14 [Mantella aurantiaca]